MRRRQLLRYVGASSGVSLLAGCTGEADEQLDLEDDDGGGTDDEDDGEADADDDDDAESEDEVSDSDGDDTSEPPAEDDGDEVDDTDEVNDDDHDTDADDDTADDEAFDNIGIEEFIIVDQTGGEHEVTAVVQAGNWNGTLPQIDVGYTVTLTAEAIDEDGNDIDVGGEYDLDAVRSAEEPDDSLSLEGHGDQLHLSGEREGEVEISFQLRADGEAAYQTPPILGDVRKREDDTQADGEAELWHSLSGLIKNEFDSSVDEFNAASGATIMSEEVAELEDQTTAAIPAGDGPELFVWAHDWVGRYQEDGFLSDQSVPLSIDLDQQFGPNADAVRYRGDVVGLPFAGETVALACNREYVETLPETFEEVLEIAAEHHDPAGNVYGFCWPQDAYHVSAMPHGFGPGYYDEDTEELTLTDEGTIAGFEYIAEEVWEYMPQDPDGEAQQSIFMEGQSPFFVTGPWNLGNFDDNDLEVDVIPLPDADGATPTPFTGVQIFYFAAGMDENPDQGETALAFAEWFTTNVELLQELAVDHGYIPVHEAFGVDGAARHEITREVRAYSRAVERGTPMPTAPDFNDVWFPLEDEWHAVLTEGKDVRTAMADAEEEIRIAW